MIIIKNGEIVQDKVHRCDIAIENDKIINIHESIEPSESDQVIDASGCYVFPGFIDAHTHFAMTNAVTTTADDFSTGTKAAIMGGTTTIINFASPSANGSLIEGFNDNKKKAKDNCSCNYKFHMEITDFNEQVHKEILLLREEGVTSFKVYMAYAFSLDDGAIYKTLEAIKEAGALLGAHCENGALINAKIEELRKKNALTPAAHPLVHTAEIEAEAINRFAYIGKMVDYPIHVVHLSSQEGLEEIRKARKDGVAITCETCPQYLLLNDLKYQLPGFEVAKYIFSPPLRNEASVKALEEAVIQGEIETIATDHCSYNYQGQKSLGKDDYCKIPNGIPGVQQRGPLMYTNFVANHKIDLVSFVKMVSENPAKLYQMYPQKGTLAKGSDADIVIYKKSGETVITAENQEENVDYTPYEGMKELGSVSTVLVNGQIVVKDGAFVLKNQGLFIK